MSVNVPREVIVDDNELGVLYNGSWSSSSGQNFKSQGVTPFSNSLHGTAGNADFSYSFVGSDGRILGMITKDSSNFSSSFNEVDGEPPPWRCFLDGELIPPPPPPHPEDHINYSWPLCEWNGTPVDSHTVSIQIDQLDDGETLWIDEVMFIPDPNLSIKNSTVYVDHSDPAIQYGGGWSILNDSHIAYDGGLTLTFPFVGTSLKWFATIPEGVPQNASKALFSIDDNNPMNSTIFGDTKHKIRPQNFNKLIYQTPPLPYGPHTLKVIGEGNIDLIPLVLSYFVLENSELPVQVLSPAISTSFNPPQPSSLEPSSSTSRNHSNFGNKDNGSPDFPVKYRVIIGSVIGGVALLVFILLCILCFRRRQRRQRKQQSTEAGTLPPSLEVKRQLTMQQTSQQEYPFSRHSTAQLESNSGYNFAKRFTYGSSTRDRPNSLFPVSRLSVLPTKGEPPDSPRTFTSRFPFTRFSSHSRFTSASSITLLPHSSSPRRSSGPLSDDETTIMGLRSRDSDSSGMKLPHSRPPETHEPPPYTTG